MLREELADVGLEAADPLAQELVEVADHLAVRRQILGRHRPDPLRHATDELVQDLALERRDELVEPRPRVGLEEVVVR